MPMTSEPSPLPGPSRASLALLWLRFTLRQWRLHPLQTGVHLFTLALGVAAFLAIHLANRAALAGFQEFTAVAATEEAPAITAATGRLPLTDAREVRRELGDLPVHLVPILETTARRVVDETDQPTLLRIIGVDLYALLNLPGLTEATRDALNDALTGPEATAPGAPPTLYASAGFVANQGLTAGDTFRLRLDTTVHTFRLGGILPREPTQPVVPANLLVGDLPPLLARTTDPGLDRLELYFPPGPRQADIRDAALDRLRDARPHWLLTTAEQRGDRAETMTAAFRFNLAVLALLALLVGIYLILQALEAAVVRRRGEIAALRSLGIEARQIHRAWLAEAAALGLVGSLLGLLLGWAGARFAVDAIGQTITTLYVATAPASVTPGLPQLGLALLLGVGASLVAAWIPAREAAATPPAQIMRRSRRDVGLPLLQHPRLGVALILAGLVLAQLPPLTADGGTRFPLAGYFAALAFLIGGTLLVATLLPLSGRLLGLGKAWSAVVRVAASRLREATGRHRLAAAGLFIATAMSGSMAILIGSFELTMERWIGFTLQGDLYAVSQGAGSAAARAQIPADTWETLDRDEAVTWTKPARIRTWRQPDGRETLLVGETITGPQAHYLWQQGPREPPANAIPAAVSEAFADRYATGPGDTLTIPTPEGPQRVTVIGVYAEYGNEQGSVAVPFTAQAAWFDDRSATRLVFGLSDAADPDRVRTRWQQAWPGLNLRTHAALRAEALRIFRQTFAITYALQLIGVAVALTGLALALASLLLQTREDLVTLRALGFRRYQLALLTALEAAGITLTATLGGYVASALLGWLLIFGINKQAFGWTLQIATPWLPLAVLGLFVLTTALLIGAALGAALGQRRPPREE